MVRGHGNHGFWAEPHFFIPPHFWNRFFAANIGFRSPSHPTLPFSLLPCNLATRRRHTCLNEERTASCSRVIVVCLYVGELLSPHTTGVNQQRQLFFKAIHLKAVQDPLFGGSFATYPPSNGLCLVKLHCTFTNAAPEQRRKIQDRRALLYSDEGLPEGCNTTTFWKRNWEPHLLISTIMFTPYALTVLSAAFRQCDVSEVLARLIVRQLLYANQWIPEDSRIRCPKPQKNTTHTWQRSLRSQSATFPLLRVPFEQTCRENIWNKGPQETIKAHDQDVGNN